MNKPTNGIIHAVSYNAASGELLPMAVKHGDDLHGTNPVAVVWGKLCPRKPGCQWCTGLRDKIRSRTVR